MPQRDKSILKWLIPAVLFLFLCVFAAAGIAGAAWLIGSRTAQRPEQAAESTAVSEAVESASREETPETESVIEAPDPFAAGLQVRRVDMLLVSRGAGEQGFALSGRLDSLDDSSLEVAGRRIQLAQGTTLGESTAPGDYVQVTGSLEDGQLIAENVTPTQDTELVSPFEFTGIVDAIGEDSWTVSNRVLTVIAATEIEGSPEIGAQVTVEGVVLADGTWLALSIHTVEVETTPFEFTGAVENISPWVIAGTDIEVNEATRIDAGIQVGDIVKVSGEIQADGAWLAHEIEKDEEIEGDPTLSAIFFGLVESVDPWVVNGVPLVVDEVTDIEAGIEIGDLVRVEVLLLPDGTWRATRIQSLDGDLTGGCLIISDVVLSVEDGVIVLLNWPALQIGDQTEIEGEISSGSVLLVTLCFEEDGSLLVVKIVVLHDLDDGVIEPPDDDDDDEDEAGEPTGKVTICHRPPGNPDNAHTITIGEPAVQAHLRNHGDTLGPCP